MNVLLKEFSREPRCSLTDLSSFSPPLQRKKKKKILWVKQQKKRKDPFKSLVPQTFSGADIILFQGAVSSFDSSEVLFLEPVKNVSYNVYEQLKVSLLNWTGL